MSEFKRQILFEPAFDRRHTDPNKNYGIGSMRMRFVLIGDRGATQFLMSTGWFLPHVQKEKARSEATWMLEHGEPLMFRPDGWDLGYHSPAPLYEGQSKMDECEFIEGGCYYDGSGSNAEPVLGRFLAEGEEAVWRALEEEYEARFAAEVTL